MRSPGLGLPKPHPPVAGAGKRLAANFPGGFSTGLLPVGTCDGNRQIKPEREEARYKLRQRRDAASHRAQRNGSVLLLCVRQGHPTAETDRWKVLIFQAVAAKATRN
jgi:hypothetical protein